MNHKKAARLCIFLIVSFAICQVLLSCRYGLYGEKIVALEEAIDYQEQEIARKKVTLSQKTSLHNLNDFAQKEGFVKKPDSLVITSELPVAYVGGQNSH